MFRLLLLLRSYCKKQQLSLKRLWIVDFMILYKGRMQEQTNLRLPIILLYYANQFTQEDLTSNKECIFGLCF